MSLFHPVGKSRVDEWEYFKFSPHIDIRKLPKDGFENLYEVVLVVSWFIMYLTHDLFNFFNSRKQIPVSQQ